MVREGPGRLSPRGSNARHSAAWRTAGSESSDVTPAKLLELMSSAAKAGRGGAAVGAYADQMEELVTGIYID